MRKLRREHIMMRVSPLGLYDLQQYTYRALLQTCYQDLQSAANRCAKPSTAFYLYTSSYVTYSSSTFIHISKMQITFTATVLFSLLASVLAVPLPSAMPIRLDDALERPVQSLRLPRVADAYSTVPDSNESLRLPRASS